MICVLDKSCREFQNTHFTFHNFFSRNNAIREIMLKNAAEQRGHSWQYNMAFFFNTWIRALWIKFNNCPTRCDLFSLLYFCRQLYVFRCWHPSSGARTTVITASGID